LAGSDEKSLTRGQEKALMGLMQQPTLGLAASQAGVSERTLSRWINQDDSFKSAYLQLRREVVSNAVLQLTKATNTAVNVTIALMTDPETPASVRLGAAKSILELALQTVRIEELEARLAVLEQTQHYNDGNKGGSRW
jgi:hypothetical protein